MDVTSYHLIHEKLQIEILSNGHLCKSLQFDMPEFRRRAHLFTRPPKFVSLFSNWWLVRILNWHVRCIVFNDPFRFPVPSYNLVASMFF